MSIFQIHNTGLSATPEGNTFHEQWVSGTYIVAGVFQNPVASISISEINANIPRWFDILASNKNAWWPRGICGYMAIPVYASHSFDNTVLDLVRNRPKYKYAMWHEPVLYNFHENSVHMNTKLGLYGSAFRIFLFESILTALYGLHHKYGHKSFPIVNGETINIENKPNHTPSGNPAPPST